MRQWRLFTPRGCYAISRTAKYLAFVLSILYRYTLHTSRDISELFLVPASSPRRGMCYPVYGMVHIKETLAVNQ